MPLISPDVKLTEIWIFLSYFEWVPRSDKFHILFTFLTLNKYGQGQECTQYSKHKLYKYGIKQGSVLNHDYCTQI